MSRKVFDSDGAKELFQTHAAPNSMNRQGGKSLQETVPASIDAAALQWTRDREREFLNVLLNITQEPKRKKAIRWRIRELRSGLSRASPLLSANGRCRRGK